MPDLSIIMPIYNAEKHLDNSIGSVLEQSYQNFELILVNDGSNDNSEEICKKFMRDDNRVRYYHKENGGASSAKNMGMKYASTNLCEFIDSDDYLDPGYIESLMAGMSEKDTDLCVGNIRFRNGEKDEGRFTNLIPGHFTVQEYLEHYSNYMPYGIVGSPVNKIYSLSIIRDNGLSFNEGLSNNEDTQFNYDYLLLCKKVYVTNNSFYNYINWGGSSLSHRYIPDLKDICLSTYRKAVDTLIKLNAFMPNEVFCRKYFLRQVINMFCNEVDYSGNSTKTIVRNIKHIADDDEIRRILLPTIKKDLNRLERTVVYLIRNKLVFCIYVVFEIRRIKVKIRSRNKASNLA